MIFFIFLLFFCKISFAQNFTFNRFSTEDGIGLSSNVVNSIYQDEKGFIWVGTANGLQRFDGRKFIQLSSIKPGSEPMPDARLFQIIPLDSGKLFLAFTGIKEFGVFDPSNFTYRKIALKSSTPIPANAEYYAWREDKGQLFLNVLRFGILQYNNKENSFVDNGSFALPAGWKNTLYGIYEDTIKKQLWICADSGLCIYDRSTKQVWSKNFNPTNLPVLNKDIPGKITQVYLDHKHRIWLFGWPPSGVGPQYKYCLDSTGREYLHKDTIGLNTGPVGQAAYNHFYETKSGNLWIYGKQALFNFNNNIHVFQFHKSGTGSDNININYEDVYQVMEDKDGGIWVATDQGLYFTSLGSDAYSVINLMFDNTKTFTGSRPGVME